jgi:hypothetical protein
MEGVLHSSFSSCCGSGVLIVVFLEPVAEAGRGVTGGVIHAIDIDEEYRVFLEDIVDELCVNGS